ncbi:MAG: hypothetical protein ACRDHN_07070, partial [Thermomicrobiales bacterium]
VELVASLTCPNVDPFAHDRFVMSAVNAELLIIGREQITLTCYRGNFYQSHEVISPDEHGDVNLFSTQMNPRIGTCRHMGIH